MTQKTNNDVSLLRIGIVSAVRTSGIEITVDADKNEPSILYKGEIISNVSIGSFLIVQRGYAHLVVQVEEEELIESSAWDNSDYQRDVDRNTRILKTTLLGEFQTDTSVSPFQTRFVSGTQTSPLIGNIAYLASSEQASKIYVTTSKPGTQITIGHLATNNSIPINLDVSTLFSGHIGIFGNSGSGKSYTLTQLYTQLFKLIDSLPNQTERTNSTRFILFDFSGKYYQQTAGFEICDSRQKVIYGPSAPHEDYLPGNHKQIPLPEDYVRTDDFWMHALEPLNEEERAFVEKCLNLELSPNIILRKAVRIVESFFYDPSADSNDIGTILIFLKKLHDLADPAFEDFNNELGEFYFSLEYDRTKSVYYQKKSPSTTSDTVKFWQYIQETFRRLFSSDFAHNLNTLDLIAIRFTLIYYNTKIFNTQRATRFDPLLRRFHRRLNTLNTWFNLTTKDIPHLPTFQIVNLEQASIEERTLIPHIIAKYEYCKLKKDNRYSQGHHYLNLIFDDAHYILSQDNYTEARSVANYALKTFTEIIIEGRKFGAFLTLASQRPSEISPAITSQLHHYFVHRLVNPVDLEAVKNSVIFLDRNSFESIPSLPCGTCIISGTSVQIPAVVKIDELPEGRRPNNETIDLVKLWGLAPDSSVDAGTTAADSADSQDSESTAEES